MRRRVRQLFDAVNAGDAEPVLNGFAPHFEHASLGEHALGGVRTSLARTREWYERLWRLMPDIRLTVGRIWVAGTPWKALVVVEWKESNSGTDGVRTTNSGLHALELRWGRMTKLVICPDTVPLTRTLARLTEAGVTEASSPPITG